MPPRRRASTLLLALAIAAPVGPTQAQSGINRCIGPDGQTVFSDRRCEDLGAAARMPPAALRDGETGLYRYGCPRRLSELVGLLRTAIDSHDVNRLSSLYLWGEQSDAAANNVLTQLETIAGRTLVDIAPMYPAEEVMVAPVHPVETADPAPYVPPDDSAAGAVAEATAVNVPRQRPWGLRLEQVSAHGSTPARSVLRLRRAYNCFWVSF